MIKMTFFQLLADLGRWMNTRGGQLQEWAYQRSVKANLDLLNKTRRDIG